MSQNPTISLDDIIKHDVVKLQRKTKIVCTLGPSCWEPQMLIEMIKAGMNTARLNFSHGTHETHARSLANLKYALEQLPGHHVSIMLDTKGPEIRTGYLENADKVTIVKDSIIELTTDYTFKGNEKKLAISYAGLPASVKVGSQILIADGSLVLVVTEILEDGVKAKAMCKATIGETKNVNLPGCIVDLPTVTERDINDIQQFGLAHNVDMIAASFIRKGSDIDKIREVLGEEGKHIQIISKIENQEGLENYMDILKASDGIMVARGDLGMEIPLEQVILAQKYMIQQANIYGKPVINATQMLESMIEKPRPTRAECGDVMNAVFDGATCVMLSGESASGLYPIDAVNMMARLCVEAESVLDKPKYGHDLHTLSISNSLMAPTESICYSSVVLSHSVQSKCIILVSDSLIPPLFMSKYFPNCPIHLFSHTLHTVDYSQGILRCITSHLIPNDTTDIIEYAIANLKQNNLIESKENVILVYSSIDNSDVDTVKHIVI